MEANNLVYHKLTKPCDASDIEYQKLKRKVSKRKRCGPCLIVLLLILHFVIGVTFGAALWYMRDWWTNTKGLKPVSTAVLSRSADTAVEWFVLHDTNTILSMKSGAMSSIYDHNQGYCIIKVGSKDDSSCLILPTLAEENFTRYVGKGGYDFEDEIMGDITFERKYVVETRPTDHTLFFTGSQSKLVNQMCANARIYRALPVSDEWIASGNYIVEFRNMTEELPVQKQESITQNIDITTPHRSIPETPPTTKEQTTLSDEKTSHGEGQMSRQEFNAKISHWNSINFRPMSRQ